MDMSQKREPLYQENGTAHTRWMGEALADKAIEALEQARFVDGDILRVEHTILEVAQRRPTGEQILACEEISGTREYKDRSTVPPSRYMATHTHFIAIWRKSRNRIFKAGSSGRKTGLHADCWVYGNGSAVWGLCELIEEVEVMALALGDIAIVGYPAEYFSEYGQRTRANAYFAQTFVSELANGWHGYVPTREAFLHGGYEPRLGDASRLVEEAGDRMYEAGLDLLRKLARIG